MNSTGIRRLAGYRARIWPLAAAAVLAAVALSAPFSGGVGDHPAGSARPGGQNPYFTKLTDAQIRDQVLSAESPITSVSGTDPWPWFRFPHGDDNQHAISVVNGTGFVLAGWTVDTLG